MQKFIDAINKSKLQPQIFSLLITVFILVLISVVVYVKVRKQKPEQAPTGIVYFAEQYAMGVENLFKNTTGKKIKKAEPYIFTLLSFLLVGNLVSLLGIESITTSYSVAFTLALITWIGIYVVGIVYQKMLFFKKFLNPINMVSQFAPLISLSFRIFGNIIGGSTIIYLLYLLTGYISSYIPVIGQFNLLGLIVAPALHIYFDIFSSIIQAFVFSLLTVIYWAVEAESVPRKINKGE